MVFRWATHPLAILVALLVGTAWGLGLPVYARHAEWVGDLYLDLLKMTVLPFMVAAVLLSLQKLLREGNSAQLLKRTFWVFSSTLGLAVLIAVSAQATLALVLDAGDLQRDRMGQQVGSVLSAVDTVVRLDVDEVFDAPVASKMDMLRHVVPDNVFAALAQGETLKVLFFTLTFGVALGGLRRPGQQGILVGLEAVYSACQTMTRWLIVPLPGVLTVMTAVQMATHGWEPLVTMWVFLAQLGFAAVLALAISLAVLWWRSGLSLHAVVHALRDPFALAVATRNSAVCMPAMVECLCERLGFRRDKVELLVPLSISLLRPGPAIFYVCASLFVAQLYQRPLEWWEFPLLMGTACLAACASAGMTGLVTVSLTSMVCTQLNLPFEAAFVLFLAVDPLADVFRTLVLVIGNSAAVAAVCDPPRDNSTTTPPALN